MNAVFTAGAVLVLLGLVGVFSLCEIVLVHLSVARATTEKWAGTVLTGRGVSNSWFARFSIISMGLSVTVA